ncbi:MAG TPA: hypothetical protein VHG28_07185 [Longimicrobiaceae bacterium]|nr:hypothetical protein [Longimicrobiaceae bacterium]
MPRLAFASSALLLGVALSACVDRGASRPLSSAVAQPAVTPCGDSANPCVIEPIEVRAPRSGSAGDALAGDRS